MSTPGDKLRLSDPQGFAAEGNAARGRPLVEDELAERAQLADAQKRIAQLERSNAALEKRLDQEDKAKAAAQAKAGGQGKARHMAHAEGWLAVCTAPDLCKVGKDVVAFNSFATLDQQHTASSNVKARGTAVYRKGDIIRNVQGDAGQHVVSGTSLGSGHVKILDGQDNVKVNGIAVARHDSRCLINCDASGLGGAQGKLVTEQKSVGDHPPSMVAAPPGERTSEKLDALRKARAGVADGMLDFNAIDEYINFKQSNEVFDGLIAQISGTPGAASGYAAQVARGLLGFVKDIVMGTGELGYEGIKAVPKLAQLTQTQEGRLLAQLDAQILAEHIKLGNITTGTVGQGALNIGRAIVKPVTDPWAKGQYVESVARGAAEVGTLGLGWLKGAKVARAAMAADAAKAADVVKAADLASAANAVDAARPTRAIVRHVDDGVHVKRGKKPEFSGDWGNYETHGIKADPMESSEGRRMVDELEKQGRTRKAAIDEAAELINTGSSMPVANPIEIGDKLFKVIHEGGSVGANSAYWATETQIGALNGLTYDQIAEKLGLPLASQQGTRFQVMEITAIRNGTSFTSVIAPTTEVGANGMIWSQGGGGLQTLLTDRSIFTPPRFTAIKFP